MGIGQKRNRRPKQLVLLFTDIEGSVKLWDRDLLAMDRVLAQHDRLIRRSIADHGGRVFAVTGDGFGAFFRKVDSAIAAAMTIQSRMAEKSWQPSLRVRAGIHMGMVVARGRNLYGPAVNHCARITSCAAGGQIVISEVSLLAAKTPVEVADFGSHHLKNLQCAVQIHQVVCPQLTMAFAAPSETPVMAAPGLATQ